MFLNMAGHTSVLCPNMGDQRCDSSVEVTECFYRRSLLQKLGSGLRELTAISVVKLLVSAVSGVIALDLKTLLVLEVLDNIVAQKIHSCLNLCSALSCRTCVHQFINGLKKLAVLGVDKLISSGQIRG